VIGGTITATLLTLLVIPTVYEILDEVRHWLVARVRRVTAGGSVRAPVAE
jgi:HAE1 family hydrophobic/amphiphilic exporter-1